MDKARFYWARIGEGSYEPVAVTGKKPHRLAYTIGCPDPFEVDTPDSCIELATGEYDKMNRPLTPKQEENARRRERHYRAQNGNHGYAGFGRRS